MIAAQAAAYTQMVIATQAINFVPTQMRLSDGTIMIQLTIARTADSMRTLLSPEDLMTVGRTFIKAAREAMVAMPVAGRAKGAIDLSYAKDLAGDEEGPSEQVAS